MSRSILAALAISCMLPAAVSAATLRGHSVDGPRFSAAVVNEDFGSFPNVEVKFWGRNVTVYLRGYAQLHLDLSEEEISDPRHIVAHDDKRGVDWEIDVRNLREASEGSHGK
jgi:hypothetical protein